MELTCELVLDVFLGKHWDPDREIMARVALGLLKVRGKYYFFGVGSLACPVEWSSRLSAASRCSALLNAGSG